ncbi:hypothetical protein IT40_06495 [Paracoccus versutus]|nr:hypothetical protein IT40_06495 [Paracoccus versutus]
MVEPTGIMFTSVLASLGAAILSMILGLPWWVSALGFLGAGVCALFAADAWAARRIPAEPHQIQRGQLEKSSDLYTGAARPRSDNPAARTFRA